MSLNSELFTYQLTQENSPFVISANDGLNLSSIKVDLGGSGTIQGTRSVKGLSSMPIPLAEGDVVNFSTDKGINEVIITVNSGSIYIIGT